MERNYILGVKLKTIPTENSYLRELPLVKYLASVEQLSFSAPVTFLVGENGTGKSTLLEAIAVAAGFNAEGGSREFAFSTCDTHSDLHEYITVVKTLPPNDGFFLRAESFYNTASYLDANGNLQRYGGISFHKQSHGEAFLSLVINRFEGNGLYLLDEPEAALSPQRVLSLLCAIDNLVKKQSQFIIATHSPMLMAYPKGQVLQFTEKGIAPTLYQETEHYQLMKRFLNAPEQLLEYLLKE
ncbi:MAG: AAA family ATPase [Peptococcaceae bacterium]|nr:AAA family ATPase [Peptococcaceae bacterium]